MFSPSLSTFSPVVKSAIFVLILFACSVGARADVVKDMHDCQALPMGASVAQQQYCAGIQAYQAKDYSRAISSLESAGAKGSGGALGLLGFMYQKGHGVAVDLPRACSYFQKSAQLGSGDGMYSLGECYRLGTGLAKNDAEARRWYREAEGHGTVGPQTAASHAGGAHGEANQADYDAGANLYKQKNYAGALPYFRRAADAGNATAQMQVGYQYQYGEGVAKNSAEAVRWYSKSAANGNPIGEKNLGLMLENGDGVQENWMQAAQWYAKGAALGYEGAEFALGRCYEFGIGVPQNRQLAIEWFQRSGAQGNGQGAYFSKWLAEPTNFIGFRNDAESKYVMDRIRYAGDFLGGDPTGVTFHNSGERDSFMVAFKSSATFHEAQTQWGVRNNNYQACKSDGGSNCQGPGAPPRPPS